MAYNDLTITSVKRIIANGTAKSGNVTSFAYNETISEPGTGTCNISGLELGYTFSNVTDPEGGPMNYNSFNTSWTWFGMGYYDYWIWGSNYLAVKIEKGTPEPEPSYTPSSSKHSGSTVILPTDPTTTPTVAPTVVPTAEPTPATSTIIATATPTTQPTQQSPAPIAGILAGLGAATLFLKRMKK